MANLLMNVIYTYYLIAIMCASSFYLVAYLNKRVIDPVEELKKIEEEIKNIKDSKKRELSRNFHEALLSKPYMIHLLIIIISMVPLLHLLFFIFNFISLFNKEGEDDEN